MPRAPPNRKKPRAPVKSKKLPLTTAEVSAKKQTDKNALALLAKAPVIEMKPLNIKTRQEIEHAGDMLEEIGLVICNVHDSEEDRLAFQKEVVTQVWNSVLSEQALTPEKEAQVRYITDEISLKWYTGDLPKWLEKELNTAFKKMIFLHSGFGAPSSNKSFNLPCSWKLRCSKRLCKFARYYLGTKNVYPSLDRVVCKCPGNGEHDFLHKDQDINTPVRTKKTLHGKYVATKTTFLFVPNSHKDHEGMYHTYRPLYPNTSGDKWGLDPTKDDPFNLFTRARQVIVEGGNIVWWDDSTVHGVLKNTSKKIGFGIYLGFDTEIDREGYFEKTGKREYQDRFDVYSNGVAPQLFPSLDRVSLVPKRFLNFHSILGNYIEGRMDKTNPQYDFTKRKLKRKGPETYVPHLVERPPVDYVPPPLTRRGQEMLVGKSRVEQFFPTEHADAME